jgi:hypothetical protein
MAIHAQLQCLLRLRVSAGLGVEVKVGVGVGKGLGLGKGFGSGSDLGKKVGRSTCVIPAEVARSVGHSAGCAPQCAR